MANKVKHTVDIQVVFSCSRLSQIVDLQKKHAQQRSSHFSTCLETWQRSSSLAAQMATNWLLTSNLALSSALKETSGTSPPYPAVLTHKQSCNHSSFPDDWIRIDCHLEDGDKSSRLFSVARRIKGNYSWVIKGWSLSELPLQCATGFKRKKLNPISGKQAACLLMVDTCLCQTVPHSCGSATKHHNNLLIHTASLFLFFPKSKALFATFGLNQWATTFFYLKSKKKGSEKQEPETFSPSHLYSIITFRNFSNNFKLFFFFFLQRNAIKKLYYGIFFFNSECLELHLGIDV